jgi:hypothetical protein
MKWLNFTFICWLVLLEVSCWVDVYKKVENSHQYEVKNLLCNDRKGRHEKNGNFGHHAFIK